MSIASLQRRTCACYPLKICQGRHTGENKRTHLKEKIEQNSIRKAIHRTPVGDGSIPGFNFCRRDISATLRLQVRRSTGGNLAHTTQLLCTITIGTVIGLFFAWQIGELGGVVCACCPVVGICQDSRILDAAMSRVRVCPACYQTALLLEVAAEVIEDGRIGIAWVRWWRNDPDFVSTGATNSHIS